MYWPVEDDGLLLCAQIGDLHVRDEEAVDGRAGLVEAQLHLQGGAGVDVELVGDHAPRLQHRHAQHRLRRQARVIARYFQIPKLKKLF